MTFVALDYWHNRLHVLEEQGLPGTWPPSARPSSTGTTGLYRGGPRGDVIIVTSFASHGHQHYTIGAPRNGRWRLRFRIWVLVPTAP